MLIVDVKDSYGALSAKVLAGFVQISQLVKDFTAVMKVDDDCLADIDLLRSSVTTDSGHMGAYWGAGAMRHGVPVKRFGKWGDPLYTEKRYPPNPQGNKGYVLSRAVVLELAKAESQLVRYANEDSAVGIWVDKLENIAMRWSEKYFPSAEEGCKNWWTDTRCMYWIPACCGSNNTYTFLTYGHRFSAPEIRECYRQRFVEPDSWEAPPVCPDGLFEPTTGLCEGLSLYPVYAYQGMVKTPESLEVCRDTCCALKRLKCNVWQWNVVLSTCFMSGHTPSFEGAEYEQLERTGEGFRCDETELDGVWVGGQRVRPFVEPPRRWF
jgi:hypothetical protein